MHTIRTIIRRTVKTIAYTMIALLVIIGTLSVINSILAYQYFTSH